MPYVLGVDVGRTSGAAAVCRRDGPPEVVVAGLPPVLAVANGEMVVGAPALAVAPGQVAADLVEQVGDDVPVLLDGVAYTAHDLLAALVAALVDQVAEAEGAPPDRLAVTHPPDWGTYRRGLLRDALAAAGYPGALLLPTVVAAAEAEHFRSPLPAGRSIAVALLGGRHVEFAVLTRGPTAFDLTTHAAQPDPTAGAALDDLLADVGGRAVKERLSTAAEVRVGERRAGAGPFGAGPSGASPFAEGPFGEGRSGEGPFGEGPFGEGPFGEGRSGEGRSGEGPFGEGRSGEGRSGEGRFSAGRFGESTVTRAAFADLARPVLARAVDAFHAHLATHRPDRAVIAGGTAAIPLLAALIDALPTPTTIHDDPATTPARGAALAARPRFPTPRTGSNPAFRPVAGSNPASHLAAGSTPAMHPPAGSNPAFHPVAGSNPASHLAAGSNPAIHPPAGSNPAFHPVAGSNPASHLAAGSNAAVHLPAGSNPAFYPVAGSNPASHLAAGSNPAIHPPAGSNPAFYPVAGSNPSSHPSAGSDPAFHPVAGSGGAVDKLDTVVSHPGFPPVRLPIDAEPPARPPVEIVPLEPPLGRFARVRRGKGADA